MKYAVFTDLDDTFFYRGITPEKNLEAVRRARENGHFVFINTGRSTGIIPPELLENVFDGIVASVGGEVYLGNETIVKKVFDTDDVLHFAEEFLLENRVFVFEATASGTYGAVRNTDSFVFDRIKEKGVEFTKLYVEGKPTDEQIKRIREKYELFIHPWYFEFTTKGCNKATGLTIVSDRINVPMQNCIAIGDSVNDIDMIKASGIPVCVENAVPALKELCKYQTCHAENGALYDCFQKFGLI